MARVQIVVLGLVLAACGPGQADDGGAVVCEQVEVLPSFDLPLFASARDVDGDGHLDFVDEGGPWSTLDGALDPTFWWGEGEMSFEAVPGPTFYGYIDPSRASIVFADIDGDGLDDIVHHASTEFDVGPNEFVFHTARQTAPRVFAAPVEATPAGLEDSAYLVAADLDGDGDDELVASGYLPGFEQRRLYTIATQAGTLGPILASIEWLGSSIEVADLDADARAELVIRNIEGDAGTPSSLSVVEAEPDGALIEIATHDAGSPPTGFGRQDMQAADFDGDGALDLFVENSDSLRLFRGHGNDTLSNAGQLLIPDIDEVFAACESPDCALIRQASAGDFDHDGAAELVIVLGTNTLGDPAQGVWLVDDVLADAPEFVAYHPPSDDFWDFAVADFDEDGCDDLLYEREHLASEGWLLGSCPLRACD